MSEKDLDFDALMAEMGVRKLDKSSAPRKKPSARKQAASSRSASRSLARAPAARAPAPKPAGAVSARPSTPAKAKSPAGRGRPRQGPAAPAFSPARMELRVAELERELAALQGRVAGLREERDAARHGEAAAEARAEELDHAHRTVQRRLSSMQADASQPVSVDRRLQDRGLRGASEAALLVRALDEVGRLPELLSLLAERPGEDLVGFLDERVALLGDCGACPVPEGRAVVRIARERCEVCRGADIRREVRLLEDACLLHGLRRVTVVGGSPKYRRQLKQLFADPRVSVRFQPGNVRVTRKKARQVMEGSDLVVIWGATILDHAVSDLYQPSEGDRARVVRLAVRGIGRMVRALRDVLQAPD